MTEHKYCCCCGEADIAVANTYYLALMLSDKVEQQAAAKKVKPFFPNQMEGGSYEYLWCSLVKGRQIITQLNY